MFLEGTAKVADWWRNLRLLEKRPGPASYVAASHPPPSSQEPKKSVPGVLAGVGVESYKDFLPRMPKYLPQGRRVWNVRTDDRSWASDWEGGALVEGRQGYTLMEHRDGTGAAQLAPRRGARLCARLHLFSRSSPEPSPPSAPSCCVWLWPRCFLQPSCRWVAVPPAPPSCMALVPPGAPAPSSLTCPAQPAGTEAAQELAPPISPEMMSPASPGAELPLRPLRLPSRPLSRPLGEALAAGGQRHLLSPPASVPLSSRAAGPQPSSLPALPSLSLPSLPSMHPSSLSLLPLGYWSFLPGTASLSVAPNQEAAIQPEGFTAPLSAPGL
nr:PREDICTED: putative uncharacterized protein FLJ22184 [Equus przewalskii]